MGKMLSPAEEMMRTRLLQQLKDEDQKHGNCWKHTGGSVERWGKGLYYAFTIYALIVYAFNELILTAAKQAGSDVVSSERLHFFSNNGWLVHGLIVLTLSALVLQLCRKPAIGFGVQLAATILGVIQLLQVFSGQYSNDTMLGVLYAITFGGFLALSVVAVIRWLDQRRLQFAVDKEYKKIYQLYANEDDMMISGSQLETIVLAYEKALQKGEDPPKND